MLAIYAIIDFFRPTKGIKSLVKAGDFSKCGLYVPEISIVDGRLTINCNRILTCEFLETICTSSWL